MGIEEFILKIESEFEDLKPGKMKPESHFREIFDWNSVNALTMIALVDCEYDVMLVAEDFQKSKTVLDLYKIIETKSKE
ncbi:MAG: acyl carrier protein [Bacteroidetes bacterium]|nr:acyl carrier protein [Bacteroidota bacterium]